jgi:Rrf2 family protein
MQLSRAGEYAVRAMLHLAAMEDKGVSQISVISRTWDVPESFLRKILNSLVKARLVISTRGTGGGFRLVKPASEITLLDVFEAIEGKVYLNHCLIGPGSCENTPWCPVHEVWNEAQISFTEVLRKKSLADMVSNPEFVIHFEKMIN